MIETAFRDFCAGVGLDPGQPQATGKVQRFRVEGRRQRDHGWYVLFPAPQPRGVVGDWQSGRRFVWRPGETDAGDDPKAQRAMIRERNRRIRERAALHARTAAACMRRWDTARAADGAHPYLVSKCIRPHHARQDGEMLVIPAMGDPGGLWSLQTIAPDGTKRYVRDGRMDGAWDAFGAYGGGEILVCEGWATGATLREVTGLHVVVAFHAGNLLAVAQMVRRRHVDADVIVCADNDAATPGNPGLRYATKAAAAIAGRVAVPPGDAKMDFNDLALAAGDTAVMAAIGGAQWPK